MLQKHVNQRIIKELYFALQVSDFQRVSLVYHFILQVEQTFYMKVLLCRSICPIFSIKCSTKINFSRILTCNLKEIFNCSDIKRSLQQIIFWTLLVSWLENQGQAHHMFSRFLNLRMFFKKCLLFCFDHFKVEFYY